MFFCAVDSFLTRTSCLPHLFFTVLFETNGAVLMSKQFCLPHLYLYQNRLELIRILCREKMKDVVQQSRDNIINYLSVFRKFVLSHFGYYVFNNLWIYIVLLSCVRQFCITSWCRHQLSYLHWDVLRRNIYKFSLLENMKIMIAIFQVLNYFS